MSGKKFKKEIDVRKILEAKRDSLRDFLTRQPAVSQQQQDKESSAVKEQLTAQAPMLSSLNFQLQALEKKSVKKNRGEKRGREGEANQPSPTMEDETPEESALFKLELDYFVEAAAENGIQNLRSILKGCTHQQKIAFISTPASASCGEFKNLTALEIVVDRDHKEARDIMLDSLLLKDIMVVINKVWGRIEKHPKAPTNERRSRWQDLRTRYQTLQNLADAVLKNDQSTVKILLSEVRSQPEILRFIVTKPIQTEMVSKSVSVSGSLLKIAIRNRYEEIAWPMLDAMSIDDAQAALTTISRKNGARIFLIANLTSRLRQKAAESNRGHGGKEEQSNADMPSLKTAESKGGKSEKKGSEINPLDNMCSILLDAAISGADKTMIFAPLEFLTSDDLLRLYHLFVKAPTTFKTTSIFVTDLKNYVIQKLQDRGNSAEEADAMLSSSHPSSNSSSSSTTKIDWDRNISSLWHNNPRASSTDAPRHTSGSSSSSSSNNPGPNNNGPG